MKKYISLILVLILVFSLTACSDKPTTNVIEKPNNNQQVETNTVSFNAVILEILDGSILVEPVEGSNELKSADKISVNYKNLEIHFNLIEGQTIKIEYDGSIAESYPAQINGTVSIELVEDIKHAMIPMVMVNGQMYYNTGKESTIEARCGVMDGTIETTVESWEKPTQDNQSNFGTGYEYQYGIEGTIDVVIDGKWITFEARGGDVSTIQFNGKFYDKSKLSEATLKWLEMSEEERMLSSYYPSDLMDLGGFADLDNRQEDWGITLEAENVTTSGLTIVCNQSGGENISELNTGSFYNIQKLEETGYINIEYLPQEYDVAWTSEAWIIPLNNTITWDVNWEWLYGKLSIGEYRIGKEIVNFRGPGDFDKEMIYAHFEITE